MAVLWHAELAVSSGTERQGGLAPPQSDPLPPASHTGLVGPPAWRRCWEPQAHLPDRLVSSAQPLLDAWLLPLRTDTPRWPFLDGLALALAAWQGGRQALPGVGCGDLPLLPVSVSVCHLVVSLLARDSGRHSLWVTSDNSDQGHPTELSTAMKYFVSVPSNMAARVAGH